MQIKFYASFRSVAGTHSLELNLPAGTTARELVEELLERFPALRSHLIHESGAIRQHVHAFINGEDISTLEQGWDTPLQPTDKLDFIPPVGGG